MLSCHPVTAMQSSPGRRRLQQTDCNECWTQPHTQKYDHGLTDLMLHWLDVPDRVKYKLGMLMYRRQHNQAPRYLMDHCSPVSDVIFRQRLRSASSHQLSVPRHRLETYGRRAFSVGGPTVWNSLPDDLATWSGMFCKHFQSLKLLYLDINILFSQYYCVGLQRIRCFQR